jgi:two-component system OmpR family response regulator
MAMRILLIEDDQETAAYLASGLEGEGIAVSRSADGCEGFYAAMAENFDLLIVDRMLPKLDGLSLVKRLRAGGVETPVLFLTTMSGVGDRVAGLNAGGDDYLVKPFAFAELIARINALGRRTRGASVETLLRVADLELNVLTRDVTRNGKEIVLQPREFQVLEYLMRHAGQVVTRTMLLENVWNYHFDPRTNVVESHLSRLRNKVDKGFRSELIHTVRGSGYCLRAVQ